jgi:hypothetical protein
MFLAFRGLGFGGGLRHLLGAPSADPPPSAPPAYRFRRPPALRLTLGRRPDERNFCYSVGGTILCLMSSHFCAHGHTHAARMPLCEDDVNIRLFCITDAGSSRVK